MSHRNRPNVHDSRVSMSVKLLPISITGIDAPLAQKIQNQVRKWYVEDIANVSDDLLDQKLQQDKEESEGLSSNEGNISIVSQQLVTPRSDQEKLEFGKAVLLLPKSDLKKEWEKLQKYMKIFLEDYEEPRESVEPKDIESSTESESNV